MRQIKKGSTDISVDVYIIDSTDGTPELGVLYDTAGIDLEYRREGAAVVNAIEATLAALTTAHTDWGFLEIGHGYYRFDLPNAAFATGANSVSIQGTVTGMIVLPQTIQLVDFDPEDAVRMGLTALPNANADAALGLPISDAGGLDLDTKLANTNEITAARMGALTDWIDAGRLDALLDLIKAKTDSLTFTVANQVDSNMLAISGDTSASDKLEESCTSIVNSTAKAGTLSVTQMSTNLTEITDDHYIGRTVIWTTGNLAGQASDITDYVGTNGVLTFSAVTDVPVATDAFVII